MHTGYFFKYCSVCECKYMDFFFQKNLVHLQIYKCIHGILYQLQLHPHKIIVQITMITGNASKAHIFSIFLNETIFLIRNLVLPLLPTKYWNLNNQQIIMVNECTMLDFSNFEKFNTIRKMSSETRHTV